MSGERRFDLTIIDKRLKCITQHTIMLAPHEGMSTIYCSFVCSQTQNIVEQQQQTLEFECECKQILDAGSWMLDETLAQTWIASLIARGQRGAPGRARNAFFVYPASSIEYPASSTAEPRRFEAKLRLFPYPGL